MTKARVLSIFVLLVTLAVSCAPASTPVAEPGPTQTPVIVKETVVVEATPVPTVPPPEVKYSTQHIPLCWLYNDEFVALAAAIDQGYYAEAGFKGIDLLSGGGTTGLVPMVAINGFDPSYRIGIQASMAEIIQAHAEGVDVVAVGALQQSEPVGFLTLITEDRRAKGPCDFKGRVVSIQPTATWYVDALGAMCEDPGLLVSGIDFTVIPAGWTPDCLTSGQCDYYCAWKTNQPYVFSSQGLVEGKDYEMFLASDFLPFYYSDVIVTTHSFLEENPELVRDFVGASIKGLKFVLDNPDEGIAIAGEIEGMDPVHAAWRIPVQNELAVSEDTMAKGLGYINLEKVQALIDFLYEHGQISRSFEASEIVDNSFLPEISG
jgi:ABC-type nitrate/sulfonate/bicarbonate transport system substrate-binding protein